MSVGIPTSGTELAGVEARAQRIQSSTGRTLRRAARLTRTRVGLGILGLVVGTAVFGPLLAPHSPTAFVAAPFMRSAPGTIFGTDELGRDVLSRFLYGGRSVLVLSLLATVLGVGAGTAVGLIAAHTRGIVDDVLMRGSDVVLAFPQIMVVLLLVSAAGTHEWLLVLAVALGHAPQTARVIRGAALEVTERDFVKVAEMVGQRRWRILAFEILPNVSSVLMVEFGLRLTYSVGLVAGASFLGFGLQPPAADWGLMIDENRVGLGVAPLGVILPILGIALLTVGTNLVTDGIARAAIRVELGE